MLGSTLIVLVLVLAGLFYFRYVAPRSMTGQKEKVGAAAKPTPIPLQSGPGKYTITQSKHDGPTFKMVTMDPLDPKKGQPMTITTSISNSSDISKVTGSLEMDNSTENLEFTRISGDAKNGIWAAKIRLEDTILYTYTITLTATASNGTSSIKVSPR